MSERSGLPFTKMIDIQGFFWAIDWTFSRSIGQKQPCANYDFVILWSRLDAEDSRFRGNDGEAESVAGFSARPAW